MPAQRYRVVAPCFIGNRRRPVDTFVTLDIPKGARVSDALELVEEDELKPGKKGKKGEAAKPHPDELEDLEDSDGLDDSVI